MTDSPGFTLQWTEILPPNEECRRDHCAADTPFGRFLIIHTDSGHWHAVDETPWSDGWKVYTSLDKAKDVCQRECDLRLKKSGCAPAHEPAVLDTYYQFEILDENDRLAASGSNYYYDEALKQGQRFLLQLSKEKTHTLTVARKEILFSETIPQLTEKNQ